MKNGVTRDELIETITHLAFHTGWPNVMSAMMSAINRAKALGANEQRHETDANGQPHAADQTLGIGSVSSRYSRGR
jgi:hypothetical protein